MKSFDFRLEKVLEVRNLEEGIAYNNLLQARQKANAIKEELEKLDMRRFELYDYIRDEQRSVINLIQARQYLHSHRKKMDQVKDRLDSQKKEVNKRTDELINRQKKRQVLDKLKEKHYQKYMKEFLLKEQKELDEIGQREV